MLAIPRNNLCLMKMEQSVCNSHAGWVMTSAMLDTLTGCLSHIIHPEWMLSTGVDKQLSVLLVAFA